MILIDDRALARWYQENMRRLPWRRDRYPYHVLVSEVMLQQTRIDTVIPYYERFIRELPDFQALSACEDEKLFKLWEGLGYYSRARHLRETAQRICEVFGGNCPETYEELISLPGIGEYTAGALLSIAFRKSYPVCDGNVLRVFARLTCSEENVLDPKVKKRCGSEFSELLRTSQEDPGILNQGIMELGETLCLPNTAPLCGKCPLRKNCRAAALGRAAALPVRLRQQKRLTEEKTVFILMKDGQTAIIRNTEKGLLSGLYALPSSDGRLERAEAETFIRELGFRTVSLEALEEKKHIFTHREWRMQAYLAEVTGEGREGLLFADKEALKTRYALPSAYRKWSVVT